MIKITSIILLFLLAIPSIIGQELSWSEEVNIRGKAKMRRFLSGDTSGFSAVVAQYKTFGDPEAIVEEFEFPEMKSVNSYTARTTEGDIEKLVAIGGKTYAVILQNEPSNNETQAFVRLARNPTSTLHQVGAISYIRANQKGTFNFIESIDHSKLLVVETPPYEKYKMEEFTFNMYDTTFDKLWEKKIKLPYLDQEFTIVQNKVDRDGNVFLLTAYKSLVSKQSKPRGLPIKNYTVLIYNKEQNRLKEFNISLKDKWVSGVNMEFNHAGDLMVGGFYNETSENGISGTFYLVVDKTSLGVKKKSLNPFTETFLSGFPMNKKERLESKLEDFYFDHFLIAEDGSAFFTAEQYYVRTTSYFDQRTGVTNYTYYYHYNDIIVVKMDAESNILWTQRVPKKQVTTNDNGDFSGYAAIPYGGGLKILFNDNPKNLEDPNSIKPRAMNNPQRSRAVVLSLGSKGDIQKKLLFDESEQETILQPKIQRQIGGHTLLLFTEKSRAFRFLKLVFSD